MRLIRLALTLALLGAALPVGIARAAPSSRAPGLASAEAASPATALRECLDAASSRVEPPDSPWACLPEGGAIVGERGPARGRALLRDVIAGARRSGDARGSAHASVILAAIEWSLVTGDRSSSALLRERAIRDSLDALDAIDALVDASGPGLARALAFEPWAAFHRRVADEILRSSGGPPSASDLDLVFRFAERMRSRVLLRDIDRIYPAAAGEPMRADGGPSPASRSELLVALAGDEAMLTFLIDEGAEAAGEGRGGSWMFVHAAGATRVYPVARAAALGREVRIFLGQIANRDGSDVILASTLFRRLLEQPLKDLPPRISNLIIVPDGTLHSLSFSGLRRDARSDPVGVTYGVSVAPSATTWLRWRPAPALVHPRPVVAVVDPAPSASAFPAAAGAALSARAAAPDGPFASMPFARLEGRAIRRHLGRALLREGADASESFLKSARLREFAILHIAAHAVVDERDPQRSAILLAPGSEREDGRLEASEIEALDLEGSVVILGVCAGAHGEILDGEGELSLARSFLQAGAEAVVGSLWPLRDDEVAALSDTFYAGLAGGLSVRASLAAARRERFLAGASTAAWAGPILHGRGDARPFPGGTVTAGVEPPWRLLAALLAAGVAAAIAVGTVATLETRRYLRRSVAGARP